MDVDSFLHMGDVCEDCSPFIIPHPLAQEMRESQKYVGVDTFFDRIVQLASTGLRRMALGIATPRCLLVNTLFQFVETM